MPTIYTGRSPISFTVSNYNQGNWGDSEPWGGMTIIPTAYTERTAVTSGASYLLTNGLDYLLTNGVDRLILVAGSPGTLYTGRPLI